MSRFAKDATGTTVCLFCGCAGRLLWPGFCEETYACECDQARTYAQLKADIEWLDHAADNKRRSIEQAVRIAELEAELELLRQHKDGQ